MVKIECRRQADPQMVQRLWEAVTFIRNQKQVANNERIQKYMQRQYGTSETDCTWQVNYASEDGLLLKEMSTGKKGVRAGLAQEAYWCVEDRSEESTESHDWYCFACHRPGKVWCCDTCHRVYHPQCLNDDKEGIEGENWSCAACLSLKNDKFQISGKILYRLLNFVLARMKDKARELHRKLKLSEVPNYYRLVYRHVDLGTIMEYVEMKMYESISDFELSAQDMMHTSAVYYGTDSDRSTLSQLTMNDCRYDLAEIRLCIDCYLASNNKVGEDWFAMPCKPTHELAWVHMKGFGFWPAKVLCRKDGRVDVRFFGKKHERALVPEEDVKHINTDLKDLRIKKSKGWQNALKELDRHKALVELGVTAEHNNDDEDEDDGWKAVVRPLAKRGTKRKADHREAEELVRRPHSDAGQVNSISTSQEGGGSAGGTPKPKRKKRKIKEEAATAPPEEEETMSSPLHSPDLPPDIPAEVDLPLLFAEDGENDPPVDPPEDPGEDDDKGWIKDEEEGGTRSNSKPTNKKSRTKKADGKAKKGGEPGTKKQGRDKSKKDVTDEEGVSLGVKEDQEINVAESEEGGTRGKVKNKTSPEVGGGSSKVGGGSGTEEDFETRYQQKLDDYKAHQEMEFQGRIEKAVEEAVSMAQKQWETDRSVNEAGSSSDTGGLVTAARQQEREKLTEEHASAINQLKEKHKEEISQTKKRQWCINCEQEAMYHCCWNTSYCSIPCQQIHWHKEHKRLCRRKR